MKTSYLPLHLCVFALTCTALPSLRMATAAELQGTLIKPGDTINLFKAWPEIAKAPKSELATIEFFIKPNAAAIARPRSFVITLSNQRGTDTAGLSVTMQQGAVRGHVFGVTLQSVESLKPDQWTHVALTVNTKTINKQARLWVNGKLAADELVFESWPKSFEVASMLSDKWGLGRHFTGELGDVRISSVVRYEQPFDPPQRLAKDAEVVLLLDGDRIPLGG